MSSLKTVVGLKFSACTSGKIIKFGTFLQTMLFCLLGVQQTGHIFLLFYPLTLEGCCQSMLTFPWLLGNTFLILLFSFFLQLSSLHVLSETVLGFSFWLCRLLSRREYTFSMKQNLCLSCASLYSSRLKVCTDEIEGKGCQNSPHLTARKANQSTLISFVFLTQRTCVLYFIPLERVCFLEIGCFIPSLMNFTIASAILYSFVMSTIAES